ncbi:hypothetical protein CPC08DRAFT_701603 [Agrocybe pediades]|nr:hypothetical protein CPC08DRAFT_701603 [Agrocybe pediades]
MLPQGRPQQHIQHSGFPSFPSPADSFHLDSPQVAKQMAALSAASQARIAQNTRAAQSAAGGTSSGPYVGGINSHSYSPDLLNNNPPGSLPANFQMPNTYSTQPPNSAIPNSFLDQTMSQSNSAHGQPQPSSNPLKSRQTSFLTGLATVMAKRGTPLPQSLTGVHVPNFDSTNTIWSIIEPADEVGAFRLAGKDVDLFKLWGLVYQKGGANAVTASDGWGSILRQFDLPEHFAEPQRNHSTSVALMLSQFYNVILYPFEEIYKRNILEQQRKAQQPGQQRPGGMPGQQFATPQNMNRVPPGMPNIQQQQPQQTMRPPNTNAMMGQGIHADGLNQYPQMPNQSRSSSQIANQVPVPDIVGAIARQDADVLSQSVEPTLLDQDFQGIKRKHETFTEDTLKRARQKTDPPESNPGLNSIGPDNRVRGRSVSQSAPSVNPSANSRPQPTRRKIEYVPLARDVQSYGGRDLQAFDQEWNAVVPRRPIRDINDWGTIDIECLCMSIRSRLSIELSYALTTFTVLSTMRGQTPGSGFPIAQTPDLLEELLDLVEELAFDSEPEDIPTTNMPEQPCRIYTNKELVDVVHNTQSRPFAVLETDQGSKNPALGPQQRPGNIIMAIVSILRNLSLIMDNADYFAQHPRMLDILLRLCLVEEVEGSGPSPVSKNISLSDLLILRKETLAILMGMAPTMAFPISPTTCRTARRVFNLLASYLVDPSEALPPLASVQLAGVAPSPSRRPSLLADIALETFSRFSQNDANRQLLSKAVPSSSLWLLLSMLVHRLPVVDADFIFMQQREYWLSFVEKIVMSIYSLVFLAPYELKQRIKNDRSLGLKSITLRMVRKAIGMPNVDRNMFMVCAQRAVGTLKLLDKAEESLDNSETTMPVLSFGMGFADADDSGAEKGTGMLGASRDSSLEMLMTAGMVQEPSIFNELDSLLRVECQ